MHKMKVMRVGDIMIRRKAGQPGYRTQQRTAILDCIRLTEGEHVTAAEIVNRLANSDTPVGAATVYRYLERLIEQGEVRRYVVDGVSAACFQYIGGAPRCAGHYHLKCDSCGELIHLDCKLLPEIEEHVTQTHRFRINPDKTVFYGLCPTCDPETEKPLKATCK